jgi:hypothetical protein
MKLSSFFLFTAASVDAVMSGGLSYPFPAITMNKDCGKSATDIEANFSLQKKNKIKKPGMVGTNSVKLKFLMPKEAPIKGTADYTGFVSWWRKLCGQEFLDAVRSGDVQVDILDHGTWTASTSKVKEWYTPEYGVYRDDAKNTNVMIQFRHTGKGNGDSEGEPAKPAGFSTAKLDAMYVLVTGLDSVKAWKNDNRDACLLSGYTGFIKDGKASNLGYSPGDNMATCAAFRMNPF